MVDLAKQAFSTNNFGLAAEIYERTIVEYGPKLDLFLGLADSFARGGNFKKAFEVYSAAYRLGGTRVGHDKLKHLVNSLVDTVKRYRPKDVPDKTVCMFSCLLCKGLVDCPVTLPCGHTYCRKCIERDSTKRCVICNTVHYKLKISAIKSNVLLLKLVEKWFAKENQAAVLKSKGNEYFERRDFVRAIELYSKAIDLDPKNHLLLGNRCHALISSERYSEALHDAELVLKIRPDWPKGYFRKGCALHGLEKYEDAVVCFLQCLALDSKVSSACDQLAKALHCILSPLPPDDPKTLAMHNEMNPSMLQKLIKENFNSSVLLPEDNLSSLFDLQNIISETIASADSFNTADSLQASSSSSSYDSPVCNASDLSASACSSSTRKRGHMPCLLPTSPTSTSTPEKFSKSETLVQPSYACEVPAELLNKEDVECALCYRVFYEPVTTPCGHVYCKHCLQRSLDHQLICPLCKGSLAEYLAERNQSVTESIQRIIEKYFPEEYRERKAQHEAELAEVAKMGVKSNEIPIFVCTLGFPSVPCPLHIFEPRYRLMVRQCMESGTRQFGMSMHTTNNEYSDVGCMLEIRDVQFFPDGRSIVDTIGGRRFRVKSRGHRDGYDVAQVEFLKDNPVEESEVEELQKLQDKTYKACEQWFNKLSLTCKTKITNHFGNFPAQEPAPESSPNGPTWAWWVVAILPLDPKVQQALIAMVSFKERLQALIKVISFLNKQQGN